MRRDGIRLRVIGDIGRLPRELREEIARVGVWGGCVCARVHVCSCALCSGRMMMLVLLVLLLLMMMASSSHDNRVACARRRRR
jgi:hypothetical protein